MSGIRTMVNTTDKALLCDKIEVCGSIRRKKPEVKDIDIVLIPIPNVDLLTHLKYFYSCVRSGKKIVTLSYNDINIDIYYADHDTFETLKLIRTGSAEHNVRLCSIARSKNWRLKANGQGLLDENGQLIAKTEKDILLSLLGKYIEPEDRI